MAMSIYEDYARTSATRDGRVTIYVDSESEIASLSTDYAPGSKAYVVDGSSNGVYVLSPSGAWKAMPASGGGGGGGGALVVNATYDEGTDSFVCDKKAGEMQAAYRGGSPLIISVLNDDTDLIYTVATAEKISSEYYFVTIQGSGGSFSAWVFRASSADDYPSAPN